MSQYNENLKRLLLKQDMILYFKLYICCKLNGYDY